MSEKEEQRPQDEEVDVEGHAHMRAEEQTEDDDQQPDVEGHIQNKGPARAQNK